MLPSSDPKERFKARSPFSPRDDRMRSSCLGEALLLGVNNYSLAHSKRGKKMNRLARLVIGALVGEAGFKLILINIELFVCR